MAIPHGAPPLQMARPKQSQGRGVATEPFRTAEGRRASFNAIRTPASRYTDRMVGKYTRLSWFPGCSVVHPTICGAHFTLSFFGVGFSSMTGHWQEDDDNWSCDSIGSGYRNSQVYWPPFIKIYLVHGWYWIPFTHLYTIHLLRQPYWLEWVYLKWCIPPDGHLTKENVPNSFGGNISLRKPIFGWHPWSFHCPSSRSHDQRSWRFDSKQEKFDVIG